MNETSATRAAGSSAPACCAHSWHYDRGAIRGWWRRKCCRCGRSETSRDFKTWTLFSAGHNAAVSGAAEPHTLDGRDYCLGCRREIPTESGHLCTSCSAGTVNLKKESGFC